MRYIAAAIVLICSGTTAAAAEMVALPAGEFVPLYAASDADPKNEGGPSIVSVESFRLDVSTVTNGDYLEFVRDNPRWRKSEIAKLFADSGYLAHWQDDLDLGAASADEPVVFVSWYAARAYCKSLGMRLPTVAEWEYAAVASATSADGSGDEAHRAKLLEWYSLPRDNSSIEARQFVNYYGIQALHGVIWEWNQDFNTALVTGESRGDSGLDRALFCGSGSVGAADFKDYTGFMRFAFRSSLEGKYTVGSLGFRCACDYNCGGA